MPNKMPTPKSKLPKPSLQKKHRRRRIVAVAGVATLLATGMAVGIGKLWFGRSPTLDTSNGVRLLPQDTFLSVAIATDPERWQQFNEFGVPVSRGVFESQLAKFQADFLTPYGYDYQRDIQPWIGKQILFGYLNNPAALASKGDRGKIPNAQLVAILPIADMSAAQRVVEQHQTPIDANFIESNYQGIAIREFKRKTGTIATAIVGNFVAIASDRSSLQQVINANQSGKSILTVPGYTKALTEIEIDRPFAQVYVNVPVATGIAAANSPQTLATDKLAQAQPQQGIAANATIEPTGIAWKGISWLKPNSKQKLVVENQGRDLAANLPANTLVMVSGGNLQRLWQDFARSAQNNPLAPVKPADLIRNLENLTWLNLESEILNWSKAPFAAAIIPKSDPADTELGAGLLLLQQASDRSAADKALGRLDAASQKQGFKIVKTKLNGQDIINWVTPVGNTAASRGWMGNLAFLNLGAPVAGTFFPQPAQKLADTSLFQQSTRSSLTPHNGQFFIDIDKTINVGNLPLPALSPEVIAGFKAVQSVGVTSAILDESSNRFDLFVTLKKVPGIAKLPTPPKAVKPAPSSTPNKSSTPNPKSTP